LRRGPETAQKPVRRGRFYGPASPVLRKGRGGLLEHKNSLGCSVNGAKPPSRSKTAMTRRKSCSSPTRS